MLQWLFGRRRTCGIPSPTIPPPPPPVEGCRHDWCVAGVQWSAKPLEYNLPRRGEVLCSERTVYKCMKCKEKVEVITRQEIVVKQSVREWLLRCLEQE